MISWQTNLSNRDPALAASFREQVAKHFNACERKFADFAQARRVLVLFPHGDLEFGISSQWADLMTKRSVPPFVDEVWEGAFGPEEGVEAFWHLERLFPDPF